MGLSTYGIQFGVEALTGNLFVNIFLLGLLASPLQFIIIYLENRYGVYDILHAPLLLMFC